MRTRSEKRPNRKNDHKVLVAEESNKNRADSDSDSTSSISSSSDRSRTPKILFVCSTHRAEYSCGNLESSTCVTLNGSGIQLAVGPQPLRLRNHNSGLAHRIMVKSLATSPHDPLGITDSACNNQLVVVIVQYGPFNPYIPIRSTTIGKSRVAIDPIAMHTSWRSNSEIASVTRTNQYNQDLGLIHSTNGNHLESPNEGSSIDHQVTIYLHAQNITMLPTNETWLKTLVYVRSESTVQGEHEFSDLLNFRTWENLSFRGNIKSELGKFVDVSEEMFAGVLGLPTTGLTDVVDVPNNLVYDARSIFSKSGESVQTSYKKRTMKYEFRLLNDILAKSVTVKSGSFDVVTHERFLLMKAIHFGLKINWSKILFDILKGMVTKTSKKARGFAAQICDLLTSSPNLTMGEAKTFPPLKILTEKTVGTYVAKQKGIDDSHEEDDPVVKKTPVKKAVSKKRPATTVEAPVVKRKRTKTGRASPEAKSLVLLTVAQEVVPIKMVSVVTPPTQKRKVPKRKLKKRPATTVEAPVVKRKRTKTGRASPEAKSLVLLTVAQEVVPIKMVSVVTPPTQKRKVPKRKLKLSVGSDDEIVEKEPDVENVVEKQREKTTADDVDKIIDQDLERSIADNDEDDNLDGDENEIARKMASFAAPKQLLKEPLRSGEDDDMSGAKQPIHALEDILMQIPEDMMLPSMTAAEITRIKFGLGIEILGVSEGDWYKASLPQIDISDKGKAPLVEKDDIKGHPAREMLSLICADIDCLVQLREKTFDQNKWIVDTYRGARSMVLHVSSLLFLQERAGVSKDLFGTVNLCTAIVPVGPVVDRTGVSKEKSSYRNPVEDTVPDSTVAPDSSQRSPVADLASLSSSSDSQMLFTTDDLPLGDEPTDVLPPDIKAEYAQLRDLVDQISLEHVQNRIQMERLKSESLQRSPSLRPYFLPRADNQDRASRVQTDIFRKEVKYREAALSKKFEDELAVIRNDLLEFRVETQEQYTTLRDNLAELIAFSNRGRDDKKGKLEHLQAGVPKTISRHDPYSQSLQVGHLHQLMTRLMTSNNSGTIRDLSTHFGTSAITATGQFSFTT
ncbi:Splicing factor 3B subunit [Dorcoceras hygrometricum]|uniref:Splicing factor 3B subunit n=1 Tax=Dorcoceras hygrometricum TaxID=472368 RepID=A0A2Z7CE89_9LAMI|nr:Splicing factor 3B subunit [Dorcoceras hygrometricum]